MLLSVHISPHAPTSARRLLQLLEVYPDALVDTCLCGSPTSTATVWDTIQNDGVKDSSLEASTILCHEMHQVLHAASKESPTYGSNHLEALHLAEVSHDIQSLIRLSSSCRKLARTPVPLSYSRHTSRFLTIWCGTLPFALVKQLGWLTLPVVWIVCWCLFGIEEIGHLIEQPFVGDKVVDADKDAMRGLVVVSSNSASSSEVGEVTQAYDIGLPVIRLSGYVKDDIKAISALTLNS